MGENRDCENFRNLISLEIDREIHEQQRVLLEEHLDHCSECRQWERMLQSGLDGLDSDFSNVSVELEGLLNENLKTSDLVEPEPEVSNSSHRGGMESLKAVFVLLLGSVIFGWFLLNPIAQRESNPVLAEISGEALIETQGELSRFSSTETITRSVELNETVICKAGSVRLKDDQGFSATVNFDSSVRLMAPRTVRVLNGEVRFQLTPDRGPLEVVTDEVRVSVVGTEFLVRRWEKVNRTEVYVLTGEVMVQWGRRIPLPIRAEEWVEVSDRGFMFHSSPEPVRPQGSDEVQRPAAGIGGEQPEQERLFRDIPERKGTTGSPQRPLDMPIREAGGEDPDGEDG